MLTMIRTHGVDHWDPDGCFGCKMHTVQVAPSAMPSRGDGKHCAIAKAGDRALSEDMTSYKRMAEQGLKPHSLARAADIERKCESALEVERGQFAAEIAMTTPSAQREDPSSMRDIHKGAPEFRRRMLEAHDHFSRQDATKPGEMNA